MFSFFKKKEAKNSVSDIVFISTEAKWSALLRLLIEQPSTIFVGWFDETIEMLQTYFQQHNVNTQVISYKQLHGGIIGENKVVFIEHYPLQTKEEQVFTSLAGKQVVVYSSLDEAFFKHFGGDKIVKVMTNAGVADNEAITHSLISKSIANAQEKLAKKIIIEQSAHSQQEWMQKNVQSSG